MLAIEKTTYAGIPCYNIQEPGRVPDADIILYHGWGSNATKQCFRGQLLASFGYRVIVPEISGHGVRGVLAYESPSSVGDFLRVLMQSIHECVQLQKSAFVPERPHFLVGHSLGGMIVLGAVAQAHTMLTGVAAMNSTANWAAVDMLMQSVYGGDSRACEALLSEDVQKFLMKLDAFAPAHWKEQNITTPILLTNGTLDKIMPATMNTSFCTQWLLPQVRQIMIADAGHVVTDSALAEVIEFIKKLSLIG